MEVGCPGAKEGRVQPQSHPKAEDHPRGETNPQPSHKLPFAKSHKGPHHTEARDSVEVTGNPRGRPLTMTGEGRRGKKRETLQY